MITIDITLRAGPPKLRPFQKVMGRVIPTPTYRPPRVYSYALRPPRGTRGRRGGRGGPSYAHANLLGKLQTNHGCYPERIERDNPRAREKHGQCLPITITAANHPGAKKNIERVSAQCCPRSYPKPAGTPNETKPRPS
ncbi:hypothetical protein VTH06DRAFT_5496 [Thermothelomyces fergusii]